MRLNAAGTSVALRSTSFAPAIWRGEIKLRSERRLRAPVVWEGEEADPYSDSSIGGATGLCIAKTYTGQTK